MDTPCFASTPEPASLSLPWPAGTASWLDWLRRTPTVLLALALLPLMGLGCVQPAPVAHTAKEATPVAPEAKTVKVFTQREGSSTHFYVQNDEACEITMTFEPAVKNMQCDKPLPYTATFPARQTSQAFTLTPCDKDEKWEYSYTNYYKLGSNAAQHDDTQLYQLPYALGQSFKVTQGYNGKFSHTGSNQYATDWQMPEGTPLYACRGGTVVKLKNDSDTGGGSMKFDKFNNYVLIRHEDGTLGHYCHLKKGGIVVKVGQSVKTGELLAHSGNTGFSSGPHLHFCVFKTLDGRSRVSLPVQFRTATEEAVTLLSGHSYKAAAVPQAQPAPTTASEHAAKAGKDQS